LRRNKAVSRKRRVEIAVQSEMICTVSGFDEGAVSYQHGRDSHVIAGGDSRHFSFLYEAITRQISRDAFWSVIVIVCALSLNLIYLWFSAAGRQQLPIENKPRVVVEEKAPVVHKANNAGKTNDAGKANDAGPQPNESNGKPGLTPNCEKELRRTADLLRFFANRVQGGEEIQSVVVDVRQHEKRLSAVCPDT